VRAVRSIAVQAVAVLVGLVFASFVLAGVGQPPFGSIWTLLRGAFGTEFALTQTTLKAIPLALTGLAVALPLRLRLWNIGAEGQLHVAAIASTWVALELPGLSRAELLPLTVGAGMAAGAVWALLAAIPRAIWGVNEIITTLLLNYVAIQLVAYAVTGPLQGKQSFNFPISDPLTEASAFPTVGSSLIHVGVFFPVAAAVLLLVLLSTSRWGYEVKLIGANPDAARVAGMSIGRHILVSMAAAGALAGLAGTIEVANTFRQLQQGISPGYGYMAIVIAALAGADVLGTIVVAFLFGGFVVGGLALQTKDVPQAFVLMLQGLILFCAIAGARLAGIRLVRWLPARARPPTEGGSPSTP
jgi:simple sugar transport system permease protein